MWAVWRQLRLALLAMTSTSVLSEETSPWDCPVGQDIVLLADSSASVGYANFDKQKEFLQKLMLRLPAMPPVEVGVLRWENAVTMISPIQGNRSDILDKIEAMRFMIGETRMGRAIWEANRFLGARPHRRPSTVLVLDGDPNDPADVRQQALMLKAGGVQLMFVFVGNEQIEGNVPPPILTEVASAPSAQNVYGVAGYDALQSSVEEVLTRLLIPCNCAPGLASLLAGPNCEDTTVRTLEGIKHGIYEVQECEEHFPQYSGSLHLHCENSTVKPVHHCALACSPGAPVSFAVPGLAEDLSFLTTQRMPSGDEEVRLCSAVVPDSFGHLKISCHEGLVTVSHTCTLGCKGDDSASVPMPDGGFMNVRVPETGLEHSDWMVEHCSAHPEGANMSGVVGLLCVDGKA